MNAIQSWNPSPQEQPYYDSIFSNLAGGALSIEGVKVAAFMRTSHLEQHILKSIWHTAKIENTPSMTRQEFMLALRLVALAQNGHAPSREMLLQSFRESVPLPRFEGVPLPSVSTVIPPSVPTAPAQWSPIDHVDQSKYDTFFRQLDTLNSGSVDRNTSITFFLKSGLSAQIVDRIFSLSDIDQDGRLDHPEFSIGMHLVVGVSKRGLPLPESLPSVLMPVQKLQRQRALSQASVVVPTQSIDDAFGSLVVKNEPLPGLHAGQLAIEATAHHPNVDIKQPAGIQQIPANLAAPTGVRSNSTDNSNIMTSAAYHPVAPSTSANGFDFTAGSSTSHSSSASAAITGRPSSGSTHSAHSQGVTDFSFHVAPPAVPAATSTASLSRIPSVQSLVAESSTISAVSSSLLSSLQQHSQGVSDDLRILKEHSDSNNAALKTLEHELKEEEARLQTRREALAAERARSEQVLASMRSARERLDALRVESSKAQAEQQQLQEQNSLLAQQAQQFALEALHIQGSVDALHAESQEILRKTGLLENFNGRARALAARVSDVTSGATNLLSTGSASDAAASAALRSATAELEKRLILAKQAVAELAQNLRNSEASALGSVTDALQALEAAEERVQAASLQRSRAIEERLKAAAAHAAANQALAVYEEFRVRLRALEQGVKATAVMPVVPAAPVIVTTAALATVAPLPTASSVQSTSSSLDTTKVTHSMADWSSSSSSSSAISVTSEIQKTAASSSFAEKDDFDFHHPTSSITPSNDVSAFSLNSVTNTSSFSGDDFQQDNFSPADGNAQGTESVESNLGASEGGDIKDLAAFDDLSFDVPASSATPAAAAPAAAAFESFGDFDFGTTANVSVSKSDSNFPESANDDFGFDSFNFDTNPAPSSSGQGASEFQNDFNF